ncbi:MAG: hypothetical protein KF715_02875 [Candidatus Didemnitutus sp.]|nr:hypothetical protein [Candidatus Didemnitutus sp.]
MSSLTKCKTCGSEMASDAKNCPKCGAPNKKGGCLRLIMYAGGGFIALCVVGAIFSGGGGDSGSKSSPAAAVQPATAPAPKQDSLATIDAETLYKAYEANEVAADEQFKGKTIKVSGVINDIAKDIMDNPYVILGDDIGVQCTFPDREDYRKRLAQLKKGESITVTGTVEGKMLHVQLKVR